MMTVNKMLINGKGKRTAATYLSKSTETSFNVPLQTVSFSSCRANSCDSATMTNGGTLDLNIVALFC